MKKVILLLAVIGILTSCSTSKDDTTEKDLTYADFENQLTSDMTYDQIVEVFGMPVDDIGSGIHIYVYPLNDLTEIWIGYSDAIVYAKHVDEDENELNVLIE